MLAAKIAIFYNFESNYFTDFTLEADEIRKYVLWYDISYVRRDYVRHKNGNFWLRHNELSLFLMLLNLRHIDFDFFVSLPMFYICYTIRLAFLLS